MFGLKLNKISVSREKIINYVRYFIAAGILACFVTNQIYITREYLKRGYSTSVKLVTSTELELPDVETCYPFALFDGVDNAITDHDYLALGPKADEFVVSCSTLLSKREYSDDCLSLLFVEKYLKTQSVCYSVTAELETDARFLDSAETPYTLQLKLNNSLFSGADDESSFENTITLVQKGTRFYGPSVAYVRNTITKKLINNRTEFENGRVLLDYDEEEIHRLPYPFDTNCIDYTKVPTFEGKTYESRAHCLDECTKSVSKSNGEVMANNYWFSPQNFTVITPKMLWDDLIFRRFVSYQTNCTNECNNIDCHSIEFTPRIISTSKRGRTLSIALTKRSRQKKIYEDKPDQTFFEYLNAHMSNWGMWLGVAPLDLIMSYGYEFNFLTMAMIFYFYLRGKSTDRCKSVNIQA